MRTLRCPAPWLLAFVVALGAGAMPAAAQVPAPSPERQDVDSVRPPALLVRGEPGAKQSPLRVVAVRADVVIAAGLATTTLDITFRNDLPRVLEGELVLPLPPGATISRFALEVNGALRDASVVEREKARVAYEAVVRQGIDPGLVEWTAGNAFRTRVYPIPANGLKRLVLGWDEEVRESAPGRAVYLLPLAFGAKLESLQVEARIQAADAPTVGAGGLPLELAKGKLPATYTGGFEAKDAEPKDLRIEVPLPRTEALVTIEPAQVRPPVGAQAEFVFAATVPIPAPAEATAPEIPRRWTILYDASGSLAERDRKRERAFLETLLASMGKGVVRLVVFSNEVWPLGDLRFAVDEGQCPGLLARIDGLRGDGGTRLGCLDLRPFESDTERFLLLSDGLSTFGEGDPALGTKPVICAASAPRADWRALEKIARGGGTAIDLSRVEPGEAVRRCLEAPLVVSAVVGAGGRLEEVYPALPARVVGRSFALNGRLQAGPAIPVSLVLSRGGAEVGRVPLVLDPAQAGTTGRAERVHALRAIDALLAAHPVDEAAVSRLARRHAVVTPFTSLIVLDRIEDYVRYKILPPKEMQEEYAKRVEGERFAELASREQALERVRALWKARVEWWETRFEVPAGWRAPEEAQKGGDRDGTSAGAAPVPAPTGAAPPPSAGFEGGDAPPRPEADPAGAAAASAEAAARGEAERAAGAARPGDRQRASQDLGEFSRNGFTGRAPRATASDETDGRSASPAEPRKAIALQPWDPKTPYLERLKKVAAEGEAALYTVYLDEREQNAKSSAFFLDVADLFLAQKLPALALRILSNLAELELESPPLLRILAHRLEQAGHPELAISTFARVARLRPEEPQSWRDLGLAEATGKRYADAISHLEKVVLGSWDGRFPGIEVIALGELNDVVRKAEAQGVTGKATLPADLLRILDVDVRIILTWDADACDMDLWVTEPTGEKAFYGHTRTRMGGHFGNDFTQGYGPEEYLVRKSLPGKLKLAVNYYGNRQQTLAGATTIQILVVKNWGRPSEERISVTRRLTDAREVLEVGEVEIK